jgi:triacylglycerol lipase
MKDLAARVLALWHRPLADVPSTGNRSHAHNPILLVHGFSDSAASMALMKMRLERSRRMVHSISLRPSDGSAPLKDLAIQLAAYIDQAFPTADKIDLIGFSMGGIIARYYVQQLDRSRRIGRLVTISAPHHGTWLAFLSRRPGCIEMRPGSAFLASLNSDLTSLKQIQFVSIWTPFDLMIFPSSSSRMLVGQEMRLWIVAHPLMILQRRILDAVEMLLR